MKKFITILSLIALAACSDNHQPQVQYQQPPVVMQQAPAPAQAPVIVQQSDNTGTALAAGAALGAVTAMALSDRDRGYAPQAPVQQNVTHVTQVNKTVIVSNNKTVNQVADNKTPPSAAAPVTPPAPAPIAPAPAAVKPTYAAAGTSSPVPTMSAQALTAAKPVSVSAAGIPAASYKPSNYAAVSYKQPAALPVPKVSLSKPAAPPAPKPAANYGYKSLSYKK
jgi:hypothetical protein